MTDEECKLWDAYINFIEAVEQIAQVEYWGVKRMSSADEWNRAHDDLQDLIRSARREIGQP
jgi:hypothetical protein